MNKQRRKKIEEVLAEVAKCIDSTQPLLDEEQDYYDNMPESFQDSDKGENSQTAIDALQEALDNLESAQASLTEASEV